MQHIYDKLNLTFQNGLHIFDENKDIKNFPQRLNKSLKEIDPVSIFVFNHKPIILFFDKDIKKHNVFKQCWNFAEAPIIIINHDDNFTFEVYNGFNYIKNDKSLSRINRKEELNYISIVSGKYFENSKNIFDSKNKVDKHLLKNIKDAREILINNNLQKNKNVANSLIGRIIFIRYLIDRKVKLNFNNKHKELTNEELKIILSSKEETYKLFDYLKSKDNFNGDWFPIDNDELSLVNNEHLKTLRDLISGTEIKTKQASLFDIYDFSIIPIEFISNVYESFIGEKTQSKNGAYYTPTFLVDYILKYTVDDYFKNNPNKYNCKILDPACGSGIFLVETLRKLISQFEVVNDRKIEPEEIIKLVKKNIYGIDKDENAVRISIFSLYLTMLDYQTPKDIEKFRFPYLLDSDNNPDTPNFFQDDFFDINAEYNDILKEKKIDFIIGNPPYGRGITKNNLFVNEYIKNNKIDIGGKDIIQPFMIRIKDISSKSTKISFVITSKVLYNRGSENFRTNNFFNNFKVEHILELSSIRTEIFENADVPVSIIFYKYSNKDEIKKNNIKYISIKPNPLFSKLKILFIAKSDFKKILQSKLIDNDYLWKIVLYGSYLDFNFIKKLKSNNYDTIQNFIDNGHLIKYQGFKRKDGNKKIDSTRLKEYDFIDTGIKKKNLKPFYISENLDKFNYDTVGYTNRKLMDDYTDLYKAPTLLFTGGLNNELKQNSAVCYNNAVYTSSVVALKSLDNDISVLKMINGLFYSKYFSYYLLHTASSTGVRQEECDDYEKLSLPYVENQKIIEIVEKIENLQKEHYATNSSNTLYYKKNLDYLTEKLNDVVMKSLNLTEEEDAIVNYSSDIIIPWTIRNDYEKVFKQLNYKNKIDKLVLEEYINIFINHYQNIYEQNNIYFNAEVLWDKYTICINFKILKDKPSESIIWKEDKNIEKFLILAGNKTLENLYIQKDIKGFESDGFYIIKPNEYKNWHKAMGYLDFYEIDDAILRAGK